MRVELLIPRADGLQQAGHRYRLANLVALVISITLMALSLVAHSTLGHEFSAMLSIIFIALGGQRFGNGIMWLLYQQDYRTVMILLCLNPVLQFGIQIVGGHFWATPLTLVLGYGISGLVLSFFSGPKRGPDSERINWWLLFARDKKFYFASSTSALLNTLSSQGWILIIAGLLGGKWVVFASLTVAGIGGPLSLISGTIANASYAEVRELNTTTLRTLLRRFRVVSLATAFISAVLLCVAILVTRVWSDDLLGDGFHDFWVTVAIYGVPISVQAAVTGYGMLPDLLGIPSRAVFRDILRLSIQALALAICFVVSMNVGDAWVLMLISAFQILSSAVYALVSISVLKMVPTE